jgi:hypothetical protein
MNTAARQKMIPAEGKHEKAMHPTFAMSALCPPDIGYHPIIAPPKSTVFYYITQNFSILATFDPPIFKTRCRLP